GSTLRIRPSCTRLPVPAGRKSRNGVCCADYELPWEVTVGTGRDVSALGVRRARRAKTINLVHPIGDRGFESLSLRHVVSGSLLEALRSASSATRWSNSQLEAIQGPCGRQCWGEVGRTICQRKRATA